MWTHLSDKFYKAQKEHRCYLCGEDIKAGEKYCRRTGVNGGDLISTKMHLECEIYSKKFTMDEWESSGLAYEVIERPKDFKTHIQGVVNANK